MNIEYRMLNIDCGLRSWSIRENLGLVSSPAIAIDTFERQIKIQHSIFIIPPGGPTGSILFHIEYLQIGHRLPNTVFCVVRPIHSFILSFTH